MTSAADSELTLARAALSSPAVLEDQGAPDPEAPPRAAAFRATIVWIGAEPLFPGRSYELRLGQERAIATVAPLRYRLEPDSGDHAAATTLTQGEIGVCDIELDVTIPGPSAGGEPVDFMLLNRIGGGAVGVGRLQFALRRSENVRWQRLSVDKEARANRLGQRPAVVWLTGLSGAGKSTIANLVESQLHGRGYHTYLLDGDNVRHGLNSDLGFTAADRVENIRRVAEVARMMVEAGLIVIVSFISPFRAERLMARSRVEQGEFIEVHVDVPLEVAERRDPKGLYGKARRGELVNFTGIDSPYEPPEHPEVHLPTDSLTPEQAAARVLEALHQSGRVGR